MHYVISQFSRILFRPGVEFFGPGVNPVHCLIRMLHGCNQVGRQIEPLTIQREIIESRVQLKEFRIDDVAPVLAQEVGTI